MTSVQARETVTTRTYATVMATTSVCTTQRITTPAPISLYGIKVFHRVHI